MSESLTAERLAEIKARCEETDRYEYDACWSGRYAGDVPCLLAEVERLRALGLALLDEWRSDELRINGEWGNPATCDPATEAEYQQRKAAWEGRANVTPDVPPGYPARL